MKKTTLTGICLALALTAGAQTRGGGISAETMQKIEKMQTATPKAVFNAMASNKIDNLAKNFSNRTTFDNTSAWRHRLRTSTTRRVREDAGCSPASTCSVLTSPVSTQTASS